MTAQLRALLRTYRLFKPRRLYCSKDAWSREYKLKKGTALFDQAKRLNVESIGYQQSLDSPLSNESGYFVQCPIIRSRLRPQLRDSARR